MKTRWNIGLLAAATLLTGCKDLTESYNGGLKETYANPLGDEIEVTCTTDTLIHVAFTNSDGYEVRAAVKIDPVSANFGFPSLRLSTGGVIAHDGSLFVSSNEATSDLQAYSKIDAIYDFPFYRLDEKITIKGIVVHQKGGILMNGIFLPGGDEAVNHYAHVTGTLKKEKYPIEYYSTSDSPQGMFSDTTKANYRLVLYDYSIDVLCEKDTFTGTAITTNGQRAFQSDEDTSTLYYVNERHWRPWSPDEEGKRMTIAAVLDDIECCQSWLIGFEILD